MEQFTAISHELAGLIIQNQKKIIDSWAIKVLNLPDTRYQDFSKNEISAWAAKGVETIAETLRTNTDQTIDEYVGSLVPARLQAGFPIYSITEAFLSAKDAILPIIANAYTGEACKALEAAAQIDLCLRIIIRQFENAYSNAMHLQLVDESEKRIAESESLQRTMTALLQKLKLDEMLEIVCAEAQRLTGASGSAVLLLEDEGWLRVTIGTGNPIPALDRLPVVDSIAGMAVLKGEPFLTNKRVNQVQAYHRNPNLESLLVIPLRVEGTNIGALDVVNKPGGFSEDDIRIMSLFADQAAIAITNTRLHHQAEQLAVLEERQRLARELHDSVSQSLYSLTLYTDAARLALSKNETEAAGENLQELRNMAREAMLDMRLLIFELHPPILENEGLVIALRTRLESVEARSGIHTEFDVEEEVRLPIETEAELYRIAQEALNNAVKHSQAKNIRVHLQFKASKFRMNIWDNGIGFDPKIKKQSGGLGLRGMEDRVKRINGRLTIVSNPGSGTQLTVEVDI